VPRFYPALEISWSNPPGQEFLDDLLAAVDDEAPLAVEDLIAGQRIFFGSAESRDRAIELVKALAPHYAIASLDVSDEDWAERSQASLEPVRVGGFVVVPGTGLADKAPGGCVAASGVIFINPSMGFGTGHHASTRLCLNLMQQIPLARAAVLDVGTGSGILAIAARTLGAAVVVAIEPDADALQSARENCETNGVQDTVDLRDVDLGRAAIALGRAFDLVLANLTGALIARHARVLCDLTADAGRLIASGFQIYEADDVAGALEEIGLRVVQRIEEEGWVGLVAQRQP
jgi:ribosomal protein L11 methyltransferase